MGVFTTVIHPVTGVELQFKCGYDNCDTYKVGDTVDWRIVPDRPMCGRLLDDVYLAGGYGKTPYCWVIIRNHIVRGVINTEMEDDGSIRDYACQYALMRKLYKVERSPESWWTDQVWAETAKKAERDKERMSDAVLYGMTTEQKATISMRELHRAMMRQDGYIRQLYPPEPIPNDLIKEAMECPIKILHPDASTKL